KAHDESSLADQNRALLGKPYSSFGAAACSLGVLSLLESAGLKYDAVAGFELEEVTALHAAKAHDGQQLLTVLCQRTMLSTLPFEQRALDQPSRLSGSSCPGIAELFTAFGRGSDNSFYRFEGQPSIDNACTKNNHIKGRESALVGIQPLV